MGTNFNFRNIPQAEAEDTGGKREQYRIQHWEQVWQSEAAIKDLPHIIPSWQRRAYKAWPIFSIGTNVLCCDFTTLKFPQERRQRWECINSGLDTGLLEWWNSGLGSFCSYFSFLKLLWLVFLLFLHSYTYTSSYTMVDTFKPKFRSWLLLIHKQKVSLLYHHTMNNLKDSVLCTGFTGFLHLPCRLEKSNTADFIGLSSFLYD